MALLPDLYSSTNSNLSEVERKRIKAQEDLAKTKLQQSIAGLPGGQSFPTSGPQSFPAGGQSSPPVGEQVEMPDYLKNQLAAKTPQAPKTAPVARPAAPVAPGSVPAPTAPTEAVSAAQAVMSEADRLATAGMNSVQRDEYLLQKAGGGAPAPTEPAGTPGAPAAPTGEFTDQNVRPTAQTQQDGTLGFAVGSKVLTPEQVAAMKPEDIAAEQRREATYNLSINKGLSTAQAEQAMAYAQQNGISPEQAISELGSRLTGQAALSAEQLAERATQEQQNIFENRKKEIDRVFEEQNAELNDAQKQAEGLARLNMAQAGSLFTATEGGYERAGKSADPYGPHTRLKQMVLKHEKNMGELRQRRQEAVNMAQDAMFAGKYAIARDLMNDARQAQQDTIALERQQREEVRAEQEAALSYSKGLRENAIEEMSTLVAGGQEVDDAYLRGLEQRAGASKGYGDALLNVLKGQRESEQAVNEVDARKAAVDLADKVIEMQLKIPVGKSTTIDGVEYTSLATGDIVKGVEDRNGFLTAYSVNTDTGEKRIVSIGQIGNGEKREKVQVGGKWFSVDANGANAVPITVNSGAGAVNREALIQDFPGDQPVPGESKNSWCLRFAGNLDERGEALIQEIGDTIGEKRASVERDIGFGPGQRPPGAGDYVLTNEDSKWGHIALISETYRDPNTSKMMGLLTESNFKAGKVTHERPILLEPENGEGVPGGKILGFKQAQLKSRYTNQSEEQLGEGDEADGDIQTWATAIASGSANISNVPLKDRASVLAAIPESARKDIQSTAGRVKDDKYLSASTKLSDDYRQESKDFVTQRNGYQAAQSVDVNTTNPQDDISLIFAFMKVVDPTSVVRESEFNTAAKASSMLDQFNIKVGKVNTGQLLNSTVRQNIKNTMESRFKNAEKNQQVIIDTYKKRAEGYRIDPEDVITDYVETTGAAGLSGGQSKESDPLGLGTSSGGGENPLGI